MLASLNLLAWHGRSSQQGKSQDDFSLLPLEGKSDPFKGCKTERDKLRANMQAGHSFTWRLDAGLSGLDCSSCWLLVYELVVSVQTDTWLFKVREK